MPVPIRDGKLIYHLTSLQNLEGILTKGLVPRSLLDDFVDVADEEIIERREQLSINDCVPFHFFARNPFDGAVQKAHPDEKFIYITVARTTARGLKFKILPIHPLAMDHLVLYDYDRGMGSIDWGLMERRDYHDQGCKLVCLAECIYKGVLGAEHFFSIVASSSSIKKEIEVLSRRVLGKYGFFINENPFWFVR
ncbi:MAG: DarT ssDNA thymidine ADP-ribosyltransferase family protein [Spirochaetia bacterium]|jgi:hypothetical protein